MNEHEKALAKKALRNVLIAHAIKWALIIGISHSLKKAAEKRLKEN